MSRRIFTVLTVCLLVCAVLGTSWAQYGRATSYSTFTVGSGGLFAHGGNFTVETSAGTDKFTVAASSGNTVCSGTMGITGLASLNGGLAMDTNKFTVADTTGNVLTAGTFSQTLVNAAGGSANPYDYTGTLGIMNGSDDFTLFDINMTNANHTGSNTVQILDIANITGDAEATETAVLIGTGWDAGITSSSLVNFNAGIACDTDKFVVADSTGIVTLSGGGTIDNNTSATVMNLTETTVRVTGILDVTGNSTQATVDVGGGYGSTGANIASSGNISTNGNLIVDGTGQIRAQLTVAETTNARVCTSADFGKLIICSVADALSITLPANGATAGSYIDFLIVSENGGTVTISPATADTLITASSADSDAVTFATGQRIGAYCRVISDGTAYAAINLGQTTMGVTDTD